MLNVKRRSPLQELLHTTIRAERVRKQDFAHAIGLTPPALSRLLHGVHDGLPILVCLRLAARTGRSPYAVLDMAGQTEAAALLRALCGPAVTQDRPQAIAPQDRHLVELFHRTPVDAQRVIVRLLQTLQEPTRRKARSHAVPRAQSLRRDPDPPAADALADARHRPHAARPTAPAVAGGARRL